LTLFYALLFGTIQGLTEFLPVSSSGHLLLFWRFAELKPDSFLTYTVVVHLATLGAVLTFLRRELLDILREHRRLILYIGLGTVPAAVTGLFYKFLLIERGYGLSEPMVAVSFVLSGLFCLAAYARSEREYSSIGARSALFVGLFQALAVVPGVSRSGATIFASLRRGLRLKDAAVFSFLLSIPIIAGAGVVQARDISAADIEVGPLITAAAAAYISALLALKLLVHLLLKGRFYIFALYLFALSALVALLSLF